jgi:hypothetical protein
MKDYRSGQERGLVDTRYIHAWLIRS